VIDCPGLGSVDVAAAAGPADGAEVGTVTVTPDCAVAGAAVVGAESGVSDGVEVGVKVEAVGAAAAGTAPLLESSSSNATGTASESELPQATTRAAVPATRKIIDRLLAWRLMTWQIRNNRSINS
jgi:hypothetical protein